MSNLSEATRDSYYGRPYIEHVYDIVRLETLDMDAIYKDYILQLVGVFGFNALYSRKLIESCGVVNGRQLFTLCDR